MIKSPPLVPRSASCFLTVCMLCLTLVFPNYALAQDDIRAERPEKPQAEAQTEAPVMTPSRILKVGAGQSRSLRQMEETQMAFPQETQRRLCHLLDCFDGDKGAGAFHWATFD